MSLISILLNIFRNSFMDSVPCTIDIHFNFTVLDINKNSNEFQRISELLDKSKRVMVIKCNCIKEI